MSVKICSATDELTLVKFILMFDDLYLDPYDSIYEMIYFCNSSIQTKTAWFKLVLPVCDYFHHYFKKYNPNVDNVGLSVKKIIINNVC